MFYNINININMNMHMNIIYKIINIIFAIFFTGIIISILYNTEYFMINDTAFFRILSKINIRIIIYYIFYTLYCTSVIMKGLFYEKIFFNYLFNICTSNSGIC